ncbi:cytochrome ubiquinol oxidase subunit I [Actinospica sp. MGRD01-02]|uniref:Cytochrome ubiquinol oxidase subunit I n=1 Tax=Actinospica acidithermotolerans TaxID=2828514 RepID=A0A941EEB3_9ACTN|nr:cytochrome ubiquinol oxidase subunit I [Actinospica acidithermotolerans]MBR7829921.1 cytochrome ubiquinol oxidase subunit I [Actinospica acidithermotolerans]
MNALLLARWQFGITTVYHFLFVPLTIGLAFLVAGLQTAWLRTGKDHYLRSTKFWGKLFLINFALGVATGIVQEFQFGMAWSAYSRFVGDVFGAPLAIEGLLAFFMESTFLGLWIFGWDRLPRAVHTACIWLAAIGTMLSAYFILAANAWMQHPVGFVLDPATHTARLTSIWAVLSNSTALVAFAHTIAAAFLIAGMLMVSISSWHLRRGQHADVMRPSLRLGLWSSLVACAMTAVSGDIDGKIMTEQQPMKMAAAEALYHSAQPASFSVFTIGSLNGRSEVWSIRLPGLLSFLATGSFNGQVQGIDNVQAAEVAKYGPGVYTPVIPVTYWSFRLMIGFGLVAGLLALVGLFLTRGGRTPAPERRWFYRFAVWGVLFAPLAASFGWIFTEMGRQPWAVFGVLTTRESVSPTVGAATIWTSLITFTVLYAVLAVIEVGLVMRTARSGPEPAAAEPPETGAPEPQLGFAH